MYIANTNSINKTKGYDFRNTQQIITVNRFKGFLIFVIISVPLMMGCVKEEPCNGEESFVEPAWVFDSLQGVWNWTSTYDPKKGIIENDFESKIHFLSMNSDSSINYETYKNDTLKKSGKLKIYKTDWGRKIEPDILLHYYIVTNENYFEFISEDTLKLFELFEDRYEHFYKKITKHLIMKTKFQ